MNWQPIETRPDEGEFYAWDPIARKQDVCYGTMTDVYGYLDTTISGKPFSSARGKVGIRKSCEASQQDGEFGPEDDEFQGSRATHWHPLLDSPSDGK